MFNMECICNVSKYSIFRLCLVIYSILSWRWAKAPSTMSVYLFFIFTLFASDFWIRIKNPNDSRMFHKNTMKRKWIRNNWIRKKNIQFLCHQPNVICLQQKAKNSESNSYHATHLSCSHVICQYLRLCRQISALHKFYPCPFRTRYKYRLEPQ